MPTPAIPARIIPVIVMNATAPRPEGGMPRASNSTLTNVAALAAARAANSSADPAATELPRSGAGSERPVPSWVS
jgi:hypothetical protein